MEALTQTRYERSFRTELDKLQVSISDERKVTSALKAQRTAEEDAERERRADEERKNAKARAMEQAILYAGKQNQKMFLHKRAAAMKRMQEKDALAKAQRAELDRNNEERRQQQAQQHQGLLDRAAEKRVAAEAAQLAAEEKREAYLRKRLANERSAVEERNVLKAEEAAAKVLRAAEQRAAETRAAQQRQAERLRAQQERLRMQKEEQEQRKANSRAAAEAKRREIERAQRHQQQRLDDRRRELLYQEAETQQRLDERAANEAAARQRQQQENMLQEAAARGRAERKFGALKKHLSDFEDQLEERFAKVEHFKQERNIDQAEGQRLAVCLAVERDKLANSMGKMRSSNSSSTLVIELPGEVINRKNVQDRELKALFDRVDPQAQGQISLPSVKRTLTKMLPPLEQPGQRSKRLPASKSMPSLLKPEQRSMSKYDRARATPKPCLLVARSPPQPCTQPVCVTICARQNAWRRLRHRTQTGQEPYQRES